MKNKFLEIILLIINLIIILTNIDYYNSLPENIINEQIKDAVFIATSILICFSLILFFNFFMGEEE